MTYPTLHPNGTPRDRLAEGYEAAYQAVDLAAQAVKATAPNARDYEPAALEAAETEHMQRLLRLRVIQDELEALACHCG